MRVALRAATRISVVVVAVVVVLGVAVPPLWTVAPWVPFLVGVVLGVPHGAVDHLVPWWTAVRSRSWPALAALLAGYVGLGVAAFAAARVWPVPALLAFLTSSIVHFGTAESAVAALREARPRRPGLRARIAATATGLAAGATVVVVPLAAWPATVRPVLLALAPGIGPLLDSGWSPWALAAVGVADAAALVSLALRARWVDAGELALLAALFLVVPPLPAFAVYFGAWHGLRHLLRLAATDPANTTDLARGRFARPVGRLARHTALPTLTVLAALVTIWTVPTLADRVAPGLVASALALVFALTVPHLVVVALLDRRQLRAVAAASSGRPHPAPDRSGQG